MPELSELSALSELDLERQRAAKNQSLFREVNERIQDLAPPGSPVGFICECLDTTCDQRIVMDVGEYEDIRSHSNRFFVLLGHEVDDVEATVRSNERYLVVSKLGAGALLAADLDPRKREAHVS